MLAKRRTAFNSRYWRQNVANDAHYSLVSNVKTPLDCRLLYDSWLWRNVFDSAFPRISVSRMLELLPGNSLTIPVALESIYYKGTLDRLDEIAPSPLPQELTIRERQIGCRVADILSEVNRYDAIVGNHIIDDLLFGYEYPNLAERQRIYIDARLCKVAWRNMKKTCLLTQHIAKLVDLFTDVVQRMKTPSVLVLRHYPSTFALKTRDIVRINAEMDAYNAVVQALATAIGTQTEYWDDTCAIVAPGSLYPKSIFVLQKGI